jgi:4-carboxymuconolactone decarboxylase
MTDHKSNERMPKIPEAQMTDAQRKALAEVSAGPRGVARGPWHAFMRSPGLMEQAQKLGEYVRFRSPLDTRIREMTAIVVAREWTQQYEWAAHYSAAIKAGLKPAVADAIAAGRRPTGMAEDEAVLHDFLSELFRNKSVSDETYASAVAIFSEQGVIEVLGVVTYFSMLAMVMNVSRTPVIAHAAPGTPLIPLPLQP